MKQNIIIASVVLTIGLSVMIALLCTYPIEFILSVAYILAKS